MPAPARIRVDLVDGRARLTRLDHSEFLSPRLIRVDGHRATVALVAACATLLAGDQVTLIIEVADGAGLEVVEPTGTVAYNARGGRAGWTVEITVGEQALLVWEAAAFVVAAGADANRDVRVDLADGATAAMRELLVLGRVGEPSGGALRSTLSVTAEGRPLLIEDLDLRDAVGRAAPGILGDHRVLGTAALLGRRPAAVAAEELTVYETDLARPGALARALGRHAHQVVDALDPVWRRWRSDALTAPDHPRRPVSFSR